MYSCGMESEHSIDSLRTMLRALHDKIEALEAGLVPNARNKSLRERVDEAKRQEEEILAKLSKSGLQL